MGRSLYSRLSQQNKIYIREKKNGINKFTSRLTASQREQHLEKLSRAPYEHSRTQQQQSLRSCVGNKITRGEKKQKRNRNKWARSVDHFVGGGVCVCRPPAGARSVRMALSPLCALFLPLSLRRFLLVKWLAPHLVFDEVGQRSDRADVWQMLVYIVITEQTIDSTKCIFIVFSLFFSEN